MNVLDKMGIFSTLVKRYVKTVDPPVSDHGGLFVKKARTHLFLEENLPSLLFRREVRFNRGRISSVGRAHDCRAGGRGFNSRGRTNTRGLKITEK